MSQLIIRDIDDALLNCIVARAANNGRSVEEEAKGILAEALGQQVTNPQLIAHLRERAKARTAGRPQTDSAELIHEARETRNAGCS